ncbi:MAG: TonB-dependent receptor [Candidatus Thiodiazotropha sp. (ex Ctena orbiculata)]|nr:TonB-dependent receptor [Candidatus Thiodiazotropha taylori]
MIKQTHFPLYLLGMTFSAQIWADSIELNEVEVISTATRTEQAVDGVAASVIVIDAEQIAKMGAQTIKDVFSNTPGLTIQYGTFPAASAVSKSSISIRGVGATGSLWLIDGRRIAGEVRNPYDMDRIPAASIERIEIVKGPMSALYGADAVGGVINIITKKPAAGEVHGDLGLSYGSNTDGEADSSDFNAAIRGGGEQFRVTLNYTHHETDPYVEKEQTTTRLGVPAAPPPLSGVQSSYQVPVTYREDSTIDTVTARVEFDLAKSTTLGFEANLFEEEREGIYRASFHPTGFSPAPGRFVPAFDVPVRSQDDNERTDLGLDIESALTEDLNLNARLYRSKYEKRNQTTMTEFADFAYPSEAASSASGMSANVTVDALELNANWSVADHLISAGLEVRDEEREGTVFSQSPDFDTRKVDYKAFYLQDQWDIRDDLYLVLGGRYDAYHQDGYVDALNIKHDDNDDSESTYRIGMVHNLDAGANLRVNLAQGYRVPDIRELFIQKRTPAGYQLGAQTIDPSVGKQSFDLEPENTTSFEIGLAGRLAAVQYDLALFHNDIEDRIQQVSVDFNGDSQDDYFTFVNVNEATTQGMEATLSYRVSPALETSFSWIELRTENEDTGKDLQFNPDRQISLSADWQATQRINLLASINHIGEQFYIEDGNDENTNAYTLVNLTVNYQVTGEPGWKLFGGVKNLFDEEVDKRIGSDPGTFLFVGGSVSI